jgi:hypothetical protein
MMRVVAEVEHVHQDGLIVPAVVFGVALAEAAVEAGRARKLIFA